ncbi:TetR/AcrR family transcriptional regulator [Profundibacterium mesophilum]|uniref:Transcriptional regulator n=1 Tax=Profundibacterium mesophilum KAUST100406-0324 TaxID=1037889 RepID=A0A921TE95_9RHOB|nr:TetR/AcrR family transcriptional regulator [Profundibacterium mesophilum]KAF0677116.1 transcriptional regulator [Profundibacterium mesophilum KAUST100406-0324]
MVKRTVRPGTRLERRGVIMMAARAVFEREGLEGASLRAIAAEAGYTPAALYFHFDSKEALYATLLHDALAVCRMGVRHAVEHAGPDPGMRLRAAAMAVFEHYDRNPRDLDLGFYLLRAGLRPKGLGRAHDLGLNKAFAETLAPMRRAFEDLGVTPGEAQLMTADTFAHAAGLLLLSHTRRIKMFGVAPSILMERHVAERRAALGGALRARKHG